MGIFVKSELDRVESKWTGRLSLLLLFVFIAAAFVLVWTAPSLNNKLFQTNKNMIPLTGSLWILILPESGGEVTGKTLLKIADSDQPGGSQAMVYLSRFDDGLIRPRFFFNNLPTAGSTEKPSMLPFRYRVDEGWERKAIGVLRGGQITMLLPAAADGGFDDLGPDLLKEAARGRKLRVSLELKPDWIFEATYDVSEMAAALDLFNKDRTQP